MRGELIEAERQLNLTSHGRFASSNLGKAIFFESLIKASIASVASFLGAILPLSLNVLLPITPLFTVGATLLILGVLGIFLALSVHGKPLIWATGLILAGIILTLIGMEIKLV